MPTSCATGSNDDLDFTGSWQVLKVSLRVPVLEWTVPGVC